MSCPTCGHTMQGIGNDAFWCPRCGTLKLCPEDVLPDVPKLVERCREFSVALSLPAPTLTPQAAWRSLGIADAINTPEDRP